VTPTGRCPVYRPVGGRRALTQVPLLGQVAVVARFAFPDGYPVHQLYPLDLRSSTWGASTADPHGRPRLVATPVACPRERRRRGRLPSAPCGRGAPLPASSSSTSSASGRWAPTCPRTTPRSTACGPSGGGSGRRWPGRGCPGGRPRPRLGGGDRSACPARAGRRAPSRRPSSELLHRRDHPVRGVHAPRRRCVTMRHESTRSGG